MSSPASAPVHGAPAAELGEWVRQLSDTGMPAFARTAKEVAGVAADAESSAAELARVILQDAAMTARLLRVANSPYYNASGRGISTVSRAVVVLGFEAVRSMCLSIAVVESVLRGNRKARALQEMARAFHAAVQARELARRRGDEAPEEIFVAALLCRIGHIAMWTCGGAAAERLDAALAAGEGDDAAVESEVLGFPLSSLGAALCDEWGLGRLARDAVVGRQDRDPRVNNVILGQDIARCAEAGWDTPATRRVLARAAEVLYRPLEEVTRVVQDNAGEAARTAAYYGARQAARRVPLPAPLAATEEEDEDAAPVFPEPDPGLQLRVLRELAGMLEGNPDINLLLEMVLEGIHRGVGMDRAVCALCSADRGALRARYVLGHDPKGLRAAFDLRLDTARPHLFQRLLRDGGGAHVARRPEPAVAALITDEIRALSEGAPFVAMTIQVGGQAIGLLYADRAPSGRDIDAETFSAFQHFGRQANLALALSRQGRPAHPPRA